MQERCQIPRNVPCHLVTPKTTCVAPKNTAGYRNNWYVFFIWFVLTQKEALSTIKSPFKVSAYCSVNCSFVGRGQILGGDYQMRATVICRSVEFLNSKPYQLPIYRRFRLPSPVAPTFSWFAKIHLFFLYEAPFYLRYLSELCKCPYYSV